MLGCCKKIGLLLTLTSLLLAGCTFSERLKHPIAKGSRIGVIANFRDAALFQRVGTTVADNASFYRRIPGLKMNSYVTTTVANDLYRSRFYRVFPIYHHARTELLARSPVRRDVLTPEYQDYVSKLIRGKRVDTIVLITPGNIDFSGGQYYGSIWWARGYGVFNRSFMFMQTNTVFAAYDVYVIDAKTFRVLANASGSFQIRPHNVLIAWHKGYAGVTPQTLSIIRSVIRKKMPEYLTGLVHQTGLP